MGLFLIILVIVVACAIFVPIFLRKSGGPAPVSIQVQAKPILTENECEFFHRLQRALPDFHVFPQVSANAILKVAQGVPKQRYHAIRNQFGQKHVDFVVCERESLKIIAIVELDDKMHVAENDKKRDSMFEQAGYRVIRFQSKRKPSEAEIAAAFPNLTIATVPLPVEPVQPAPVITQPAIPPKQESS